jgi:hypothetical protein
MQTSTVQPIHSILHIKNNLVHIRQIFVCITSEWRHIHIQIIVPMDRVTSFTPIAGVVPI